MDKIITMKTLFIFRNAEWLGIEYLSSVLKKAGHQTKLLFNPGAGDIEFKIPFFEKIGNIDAVIIEEAIRYNPDLIAFSSLTNIYSWQKKIAVELKKHLAAPIIFGGIHATAVPDQMLSQDFVDMVCIGEGEEALVELAHAMANHENIYSIQNIWFKNNGSIIKNSVRPLIHDLDVLPFPDKEIFYKYGCFYDRLYIMTGRGCPFSCSYCYNATYKNLYGSKNPYVRRRSVRNVIDEILYFRSRYPIKEIFFYDDIFTIQKQWLEEFASSYPKEVGLPYKCLIHVDTIDEEIMRLLSKSGCYYVDMGLESGNEKIRKQLLYRNTTNEQIKRVAHLLRKYRIPFTTLNMVGLPSEAQEEMWDTVDLNIAIKPNNALFTTFYPFPNTPLTDRAELLGYIDDEVRLKLNNGEKSYKESTILNHPEKDTILWISSFAPILVKWTFLTAILKRLKPNRFFRFIAIFFSSPLRNIFFRTKELVLMYVKTRTYYYMKRNIRE